MIDLDRFIVELDRLITAVHLYDELYCDDEAIKVVNSVSSQAFNIIRFSMHNDIVMSAAKLIYDGKGYKTKDQEYEYLSQYNLATKYEHFIDGELQTNRDRIRTLKESLNVKNYRDLVLAHNDKPTLTGESELPKHNLETTTLLELLQESRLLFFGIRLKLAKEQGETSLAVSGCNVVRSGVGYNLVRKLKNITNKGSRRIHAQLL
ncbi:hypothetical protein [Microbulbifer variabilis]|uniref:AbiU2 domain-containing protein n=1 Tax=Microbulbifer variabilis TaxID=266805 RepID=UPI001CFE8CCC|nr:hypothetical protein [Microbulbifer variabilis]